MPLPAFPPGGAERPSLSPVGQAGHDQRAARVSTTSTARVLRRLMPSTSDPVALWLCHRQVSEGPDVVGDGGPVPPEAFPRSPVPPGDGSRDAVDRPQPHRLLPQQGPPAFFTCHLAREK